MNTPADTRKMELIHSTHILRWNGDDYMRVVETDDGATRWYFRSERQGWVPAGMVAVLEGRFQLEAHR